MQDEKTTRLLIKHGFIKKDMEKKLEERIKKSGLTHEEFVKQMPVDELKEFADEEQMEIERLEKKKFTGYPKPVDAQDNEANFRIHYESYALSIEEIYFWIMHHMRQDWGFSTIHKITDVFTASEQSAFFGTAQQRLGIQQDRAAQYMKYIGDMMKSLFQIVRELRILDERLKFYDDILNKTSDSAKSDFVLKGLWVDMVEGGMKNPASVYGMAQQVGFVTLPDLFFRTHIRDTKDIDEAVKRIAVNEKVKEILTRKLTQFVIWMHSTYKELNTRKSFTLKYLKQHYLTIRMYLNWIKPYLRNIRRMSMSDKMFTDAEIVGAFETSMVELEILAHPQPIGKWYPVIIAHYDFRTIPQLSYQTEGYQRGPIHIGKVIITLRGYVWKEEQIKNFMKLRQEEELDLLKSIDETVKENLEALGDELKSYLEESGEIIKKAPEKKKEKVKHPGAADPFINIFKGFSEVGKAIIPSLERKGKKGKNQKWEAYDSKKDYGAAKGKLTFTIFQVYKNFKKSHFMISW